MKCSPNLRTKTISRAKKEEGGYILIAVLLVVTLAIIALAANVPRIATQIRRERELELIERGKQYQRAIQLFYRKFGRYPMSLEQLENTNDIRFLRRRFPDPITGSEDWRIIRLGQAKPKKLPAYMKGAQQPGQSAASLANAQGQSQPGTEASKVAQPAGASAAQPTAAGGQTSTAGAPIVGVASTSKKESLIEYEGQTHYNDWEFTYDPALDPLLRQGLTPGAGVNTGTPEQQGNPAGPGTPTPGGMPAGQPTGPGSGPGTQPQGPQPQGPQ